MNDDKQAFLLKRFINKSLAEETSRSINWVYYKAQEFMKSIEMEGELEFDPLQVDFEWRVK
jgi:hypothetical protein